MIPLKTLIRSRSIVFVRYHRYVDQLPQEVMASRRLERRDEKSFEDAERYGKQQSEMIEHIRQVKQERENAKADRRELANRRRESRSEEQSKAKARLDQRSEL